MYTTMLCKNNRPTLITNPRYNTKHISLSFKKKKPKAKTKTKTTYHVMHECNAMQILKAKRKQKYQKKLSQRVLR